MTKALASSKNHPILHKGIKAVFFDAGGTLFRPFPSVGYYYSQVAAKYGCPVDPEGIEASFHRVWREHDVFGGMQDPCSEKIEKDFWHKIVTEVFKEENRLRAFDDFFEELYNLFAEPAIWKLYPEVHEVLQTLRDKGFVLGLVSNWDSRLVKLCRGLEVDRFFDFMLISAVFGIPKPNPKIFQEALRKANIKAEEAVHVGDSLEDDVRGADQAGIKAVWLDRSGRQNPFGENSSRLIHRIQNLEELI